MAFSAIEIMSVVVVVAIINIFKTPTSTKSQA